MIPYYRLNVNLPRPTEDCFSSSKGMQLFQLPKTSNETVVSCSDQQPIDLAAYSHENAASLSIQQSITVNPCGNEASVARPGRKVDCPACFQIKSHTIFWLQPVKILGFICRCECYLFHVITVFSSYPLWALPGFSFLFVLMLLNQLVRSLVLRNFREFCFHRPLSGPLRSQRTFYLINFQFGSWSLGRLLFIRVWIECGALPGWQFPPRSH